MQRLLALLMLLILLPILLLVSLLIALISGVPIIFTQERIGLNNSVFVIIKFRTMRNDRITLLGKILRKTGIDELPQLFNIVEGSMNFVGPRPLTNKDIVRLGWDDASYSRRWTVKPGITGLAQLSAICDANVSWANDQKYIEKRSFLLDLKIISKSLLIPILGKSNKSTSKSTK